MSCQCLLLIRTQCHQVFTKYPLRKLVETTKKCGLPTFIILVLLLLGNSSLLGLSRKFQLILLPFPQHFTEPVSCDHTVDIHQHLDRPVGSGELHVLVGKSASRGPNLNLYQDHKVAWFDLLIISLELLSFAIQCASTYSILLMYRSSGLMTEAGRAERNTGSLIYLAHIKILICYGVFILIYSPKYRRWITEIRFYLMSMEVTLCPDMKSH